MFISVPIHNPSLVALCSAYGHSRPPSRCFVHSLFLNLKHQRSAPSLLLRQQHQNSLNFPAASPLRLVEDLAHCRCGVQVHKLLYPKGKLEPSVRYFPPRNIQEKPHISFLPLSPRHGCNRSPGNQIKLPVIRHPHTHASSAGGLISRG